MRSAPPPGHVHVVMRSKFVQHPFFECVLAQPWTFHILVCKIGRFSGFFCILGSDPTFLMTDDFKTRWCVSAVASRLWSIGLFEMILAIAARLHSGVLKMELQYFDINACWKRAEKTRSAPWTKEVKSLLSELIDAGARRKIIVESSNLTARKVKLLHYQSKVKCFDL